MDIFGVCPPWVYQDVTCGQFLLAPSSVLSIPKDQKKEQNQTRGHYSHHPNAIRSLLCVCCCFFRCVQYVCACAMWKDLPHQTFYSVLLNFLRGHTFFCSSNQWGIFLARCTSLFLSEIYLGHVLFWWHVSVFCYECAPLCDSYFIYFIMQILLFCLYVVCCLSSLLSCCCALSHKRQHTDTQTQTPLPEILPLPPFTDTHSPSL